LDVVRLLDFAVILNRDDFIDSTNEQPLRRLSFDAFYGTTGLACRSKSSWPENADSQIRRAHHSESDTKPAEIAQHTSDGQSIC
jgi:hypothetical protein